MTALGWLLRIIGGAIIVLGWFGYLGTFGEDGALQFMADSILYPVIATIIGIIVLIVGGAIGRSKERA